MNVVKQGKPLPSPKNFFGLKNIREMGQKGWLEAVRGFWQTLP